MSELEYLKIQAGDIFEIACDNSNIKLTQGQKIPEKDPFFVVLNTQGTAAQLGPLRAGKSNFQVLCADNSTKEVAVQLTPLSPQQMPKHEAPIAPFALSYPMWILWGAIALALVMSLFGIYFYYQKRRKLRLTEEKKQIEKLKKPDKLFVKYVNYLSHSSDHLKASDDEIIAIYNKSSQYLRKFLEYRMDFRAHFASTPEYVAAFKQAVLKKYRRKAEQSSQIVESILLQSDQARFAREIPSKEQRAQYHELLKKIILKFPDTRLELNS